MSLPFDHWLRPLLARTESRQEPRSERLFAGHRGRRPEVYVVTRSRVEPLRHFHDGTPFNWGIDDAGAVELAYALLHDVRVRPKLGDVLELAASVIAHLPRDGFVLSADDVRRWRGRPTIVTDQAWISVQCWMFPFAWMVGRPADRSENAGHEWTDR